MNNTGKYIAGKKDILSVYTTGDYPNKGDTQTVLLSLQRAGVDLIEIRIPFSDPLADGPTIQKSNAQALANGFCLKDLFRDLAGIRSKMHIPLILMGYFNTVLAYGIRAFLKQCQQLQIDTLILPDLPPEIFDRQYKDLFEKFGVSPVFLITPQTSKKRVRYIETLSKAFVYVVSDNSITGSTQDFSPGQQVYFKKTQKNLDALPSLIGFGVSNHASYRTACDHAHGVIIGSAFIRALGNSDKIRQKIPEFVEKIKKD